MPTPVFNNVVITAANDPLTPLVAYSADRTENNAVDGAVQTYANGRRRAVQQVGVAHNFTLTLKDVTDLPQVLPAPGSGTIVPLALIQSTWIGIRIVIRDHKGRYFEGVYFQAGVAERKAPHLYDVAISVVELTPDGA